MARVIKLFNHILSRLKARVTAVDIGDLPASIREDIGLPADPDPPKWPFRQEHFWQEARGEKLKYWAFKNGQKAY